MNTVRALLQHTPVDEKDADGDTPLMHAVNCVHRPAHLEIVSMLLKHDADINATTNNGLTALHLAAWDPVAPVNPGATPDSPKKAMLRLLLAKGANVNARASGKWWHGVTPLHQAARTGSLYNVKTLLAAHADVKAKDDLDHTVLHSAILFSLQESNLANTPLAPKAGHKEIVKTLLENGVEVNAKDKLGNTALKLAVDAKWTDIADLIRKQGGRE